MEIIVYVSLFLTSSFIFYIFYEAVLMPKQVVKERLDNVKVMADTRDAFDEEMRESFADRVINPVYERMIQALGNLAPSSIKRQYELLLSSSGTRGTNEASTTSSQSSLMLGFCCWPSVRYFLMRLTDQPTNGIYMYF